MIVMSKKKEKDTLPDIIKAEELELEFPKNKYLEKKETDRIESAILKSGIVTKDGNCFIGLTLNYQNSFHLIKQQQQELIIMLMKNIN